MKNKNANLALVKTTKEEYEKIVESHELNTRTGYAKAKEEYNEFMTKYKFQKFTNK